MYVIKDFHTQVHDSQILGNVLHAKMLHLCLKICRKKKNNNILQDIRSKLTFVIIHANVNKIVYT